MGGVVGAALISALAILFVRRKRANTKEIAGLYAGRAAQTPEPSQDQLRFLEVRGCLQSMCISLLA